MVKYILKHYILFCVMKCLEWKFLIPDQRTDEGNIRKKVSQKHEKNDDYNHSRTCEDISWLLE